MSPTIERFAMAPGSAPVSIAFEGDRCIASGTRREVARIAKRRSTAARMRRSSFSTANTGRRSRSICAVPWRMSWRDCQMTPARRSRLKSRRYPPPRGPGRPKLGVVAREVTLLPRHWEWLARQTRRRLGRAAKAGRAGKPRPIAGQRPHPQAAGRGLSLHVGHGRQQAGITRTPSRALFAGDAERFRQMDRRTGPPTSAITLCGSPSRRSMRDRGRRLIRSNANR